MGLVTEEVEIQIVGRTYKRYSELGYDIPQRWNEKLGRYQFIEGSRIMVNVKDLNIRSGVHVIVECDVCHKQYSISWDQYNRHNHDGKTYCVKCSGILHSGENAYNWNPDLTDEDRADQRRTPEYLSLIRSALARDKYRCRVCGDRSSGLEVHHLNGYSEFRDQRLDIDNVVTLCKPCHYKFHGKYTHSGATKEKFEEWIGMPFEQLPSLEYLIPPARMVYCVDTGECYNSASDLAKELKVEKETVYGNLAGKTKAVKGKHYLWLEDYEKMSGEDFSEYWERVSPENYGNISNVVLLNTGERFISTAEAARTYPGASTSDISECCSGKIQYGGFDDNSIPLQWRYARDYDSGNYVKYKNSEISCKYHYYICLTTFDYPLLRKDIKAKYDISPKAIDRTKTLVDDIGVFEVYGLHFMRYYSFVDLDDSVKEMLKKKYYIGEEAPEKPKPRAVYCVDDELVFNSAYDASKYYGCDSGNVVQACNKQRKRVLGLHFFWLDEYKSMSEEDIKSHIEWMNKSAHNGKCSRLTPQKDGIVTEVLSNG